MNLLVQYLIGPVAALNRRYYVKLFERMAFALNDYPGVRDFITVQVRPKVNSGAEFELSSWNSEPVAILIQGPIVTRDDFTIESIRLYRQMFPFAPIVLATWDGEAKDEIGRAEQYGATVVLCKKPSNPGFLNFNYQRTTTLEGLERVAQLHMSTVLKTRSDQRIYNRFALHVLHALLVQFPARANDTVQGRLFVLSLTTLIKIPFHLCDMLQFGYVEDVRRFWSAPPHTHDVSRSEYVERMEGQSTVEEVLNRVPTNPEVWLGLHYATNLYGSSVLEEPEAAYGKLLSEAIGIVDKNLLDLFWPKYHAFEDHADYRLDAVFERLTFAKWLSMMPHTGYRLPAYSPRQVV